MVGPLAALTTSSPARADVLLSDTLVAAFTVTPIGEVIHPDGSVTDTWNADVPGIGWVPVIGDTPANSTLSLTANTDPNDINKALAIAVTPPPIETPLYNTTSTGYPKSWCVTMQPSGGYGAACDYQQLLHQNGADWYLSDDVTYSAHYGNGAFDPSLRNMTSYVTWSANNTIVRWAPGGTDSPGSCQQVTYGVSFYGSVSMTFNECPQQYGIYTRTSTRFGARWLGQTQQWISDNYVDIDHSPPNAAASTTLYAYMSWS